MEDPTVRSVDSGSKLGSKDLESLSPTPSPLDCERNGGCTIQTIGMRGRAL